MRVHLNRKQLEKLQDLAQRQHALLMEARGHVKQGEQLYEDGLRLPGRLKQAEEAADYNASIPRRQGEADSTAYHRAEVQRLRDLLDLNRAARSRANAQATEVSEKAQAVGAAIDRVAEFVGASRTALGCDFVVGR